MITITFDQINIIRKHAENDYPYECCGILIGVFNGENKYVKEIFPISNAREEEVKRNRFLITDKEFIAGEKKARDAGLDIIGFYHSHPDHPAAPSDYDREHAWPIYSYIIVSVQKGKAKDFLSWELENDREIFKSEIILKGN